MQQAMNDLSSLTSRRRFLGMLVSALAWCVTSTYAQRDGAGKRMQPGDFRRKDDEDYTLPEDLKAFALLSLVLGRVSDRSVTVSSLAQEDMEGYFEYGLASGNYAHSTPMIDLPACKPVEVVVGKLQPDTRYFYRFQWRKPGETTFTARPECCFHTQRVPGSTFTFGVQGDSHPERPQMSDPALYARTLLAAASGNPDFYFCMGDDFSVDTLRTVNADTVAQRYTLQRPFLGLVAQSAPLVLVNGNHEQASLFNFKQTDIRHDVAVWAQTARNKYFPMPAEDGFYSGDHEPLDGIGALRDYYAWTWGDALFVVLDNYWHSSSQVDSGFQEGQRGHDVHKDRDWSGMTIGDAQYHWFKRTLEQSQAKYKFVFAHHVLGTGRGGVEDCGLFEWGGQNRRGDWIFAQQRPGWDMPIHQLMAKHHVTIFFQGHDHLFARQERDGVIYQEVPNPADQGYIAYNQDRYQSGITLPNAGHLRVTVSSEQVKVDYVRCYLPGDENDKRKNGEIAYTYTIKAQAGHV